MRALTFGRSARTFFIFPLALALGVAGGKNSIYRSIISDRIIMGFLIAAFHSLSLLVKEQLDGEDGATAVEYGLLVGLIAVVIVAALLLLGPQLAALFTGVSNVIPTPTP